jgi:hypothetical protein
MEKTDIHNQYRALRNDYPYRIAEMKKELGKKLPNNNYKNFILPCHMRSYISWVLDEMQRRGEAISPYLKEIDPLDCESEEFIQQHLALYIQHVEGILQSSIRSFHPSDYSDRWLFFTTVDKRTFIEHLLIELGKYRDVSHYREQMAQLDEEFQKNIPEAIKNETYFPSDTEYSPKEYWWKHLEEVYGVPEPGPDDPF